MGIGVDTLTLTESLDRFVAEQMDANGFQPLPVMLPYARSRQNAAPFHHRDPFDRLLAAQALVEGLSVVSADPVFKRYGVKRVW